MRKLLVLPCYIFFVLQCFSQTEAIKLDSLLQAEKKYSLEDSSHVALLFSINNSFIESGRDDNFLVYLDKAIRLSEKLNNPRLIVKSYSNKANYDYRRGDHYLALPLYLKTLDITTKLGDNEKIFTCNYLIGSCYMYQRELYQALAYFNRNLVLCERTNNKQRLAETHMSIGRLYTLNNDYIRALEHNQKAMALAESIGDKNELMFTCISAGQLYCSLMEYDKAELYYLKSLALYQELGINKDIYKIYADMAELYLQKGDYQRSLDYNLKALNLLEGGSYQFALANAYSSTGLVYGLLNNFNKGHFYLQKALEIHTATHNQGDVAKALEGIGKLYLMQKDYTNAFIYCKRSYNLADSIGDLTSKRNSAENLSILYEKTGKYDSAYSWFKTYITFRDSLNNNEKIKQIRQKEMQYEFDKKESELTLKNTISDEKLKQQILIAKQKQQELELNSKQLAISKQQEDIQRLAFLKEKAEKQEKEKQLSLAGKEKELRISEMNSLTQEKNLQQAQLESRSMQRNLVLIGAIFLLVALFFIFRNSQNQKRANVMLSELNSDVSIKNDQLTTAISDLKKTQQQLIQQEKLASLGQLTAGIAHEIKNPLNFVNNFAELSNELLEELKTADKEDDIRFIINTLHINLAKINEHGKRADSIVRNMLEHSRGHTGEKEPTDINALCEEFLNLAYHGMRARKTGFDCALNISLAEYLPKVNLIQQDISRVLLNLYNNAFDAVNQKAKEHDRSYKPKVILKTTKSNIHINISVTDNGNGIPQGIRDKIFDPFFTTKPPGEGTGLGLSLSYDIVKFHGGTLTVVSEEKEFTEFTVSLLI